MNYSSKYLNRMAKNPLTVLCILTSKVHLLLDYYLSTIIGSHSGITKCFKTISQRFYCPNLAEHLCTYIAGCHKHQLFKKGRNFDRPYQKRLSLNFPAMTKISMDITEMPPNHGYTDILLLIHEVSNFLLYSYFTQLELSKLLMFLRKVI